MIKMEMRCEEEEEPEELADTVKFVLDKEWVRRKVHYLCNITWQYILYTLVMYYYVNKLS